MYLRLNSPDAALIEQNVEKSPAARATPTRAAPM